MSGIARTCRDSAISIIVVAGRHPGEVIGGSEMQAHLIARSMHRMCVRVTFCTWFSNLDGISTEPDGLPHAAIHKAHVLPARMVRFVRLVRAHATQVVCVRCFYACWWIKLLSVLFRFRVVYHVSSDAHCAYELGAPWIGWRSLHRRLLHDARVFASRFADAIISQTFQQQALIRQNLHRKAVVVYSGHPVPLPLPPIKAKSPRRVVWIGKHWKHPEIFVELARLLKGHDEIRFDMIGIFPNRTAEPFKVVEEELKSFRFLGQLTCEEVNSHLDNAHVLVCTSDYEGFSNTFIQAWLRGVPVISMKVNPDGLLTDRGIGFVSPTPEAMAEDILRLFADGGSLFERYSKNAYEYARRHHDIERTAAQVLDVCRNVLQGEQGEGREAADAR